MKMVAAAVMFALLVSITGTVFAEDAVMPEPLWGDVYFGTGSAELDDGAKKTLDMLGDLLKDMPGATVMLAGYDEPGSPATESIEMGYKRVDAVSKYLAARGVEPAGIKAISFGNTRGGQSGGGDKSLGNSRVRYRIAPSQDPAQMQGRPSGVCQKCKM